MHVLVERVQQWKLIARSLYEWQIITCAISHSDPISHKWSQCLFQGLWESLNNNHGCVYAFNSHVWCMRQIKYINEEPNRHLKEE